MAEKWWQKATVYQVYPKSFCDSNGDGMGDLNGITKKLDYLQELGIDVIWLSPVNQSPMFDNGYDISDYYKIDPSFGTNEDMDRLLAEAAARKIRIIMDLVVNHCSYEHEWFKKALADPEGNYGDYFYFRKGREGTRPNNWRSVFGGSVWEKVPDSDYYYLHIFTKEQPDLNWENPKLREEIYKMMNFWLDKGVAGFRLDAITYLKKEEGLPAYPADAADGLVSVSHGSLNRPGIEVFLREMKEKTYGRQEALTVGEVAGVEGREILPFVSLEDGCFAMIFDFSYNQLDLQKPNHFWCQPRKWEAEELKRNLFETQLSVQPEGWIADCLENHDSPRAIDYFLPEEGRNFYGASLLAAMNLGLRGTPFIYQGQELGMRNFPFPSLEDYDDCSSHNQYQIALEKGFSEKEALQFVQARSRDNSRYPFPWDASEKAGFTTGTPWLPINPDHTVLNAEAERKDKDSLFHVYQKLIGLRKNPVYQELLTTGAFKPYRQEERNLVAYQRFIEGKEEAGSILVLCNYQNNNIQLDLPDKNGKIIFDNYHILKDREESIRLKAYQACMIYYALGIEK